ncbi:NADH:ubiquinone reductase (Na(+)-transporting) subunit E [Verrucomicrobiota bacterium]
MTESLMGHIAVIFLAAVLTNNILLSKFLGMCSFIALSRNLKTSVGMGVAVTFVSFCTAIINYLVYYGILVKDAPLLAADLTYLSFIVFIMVIAGFVQLVEMIIERVSMHLYHSLGIYLPLITVNCAILGVTLFMVEREQPLTLLDSGIYGLGSGVGWLFAICMMAGISQRIEGCNIPKPLKGLGITLIITGIMAMAFLGFSGIVDM